MRNFSKNSHYPLGNGLMLPTVFERLFQTPPQPVAHNLPAWSERPKLGRRETQVLQELAKGRLLKEIPRYIPPAKNGKPINVLTVKMYVKSLKEKLNVSSHEEAVTKAAALGLLPLNLSDLLRPMQDNKDVSFNAFVTTLLVGIEKGQQNAQAAPARQLAALGLMLFFTASLSGLVHEGHVYAKEHEGKGIIFEFTSDGQLVRSFDGGGNLMRPTALTFAPPAAERHGFRKGNLFVVDQCFPDALNHARVVELTPDGRYVRAFTGGAYLSTRMGASGMAFTRDGRLLVSSGYHTDSVLEFTEGGRFICRFVPIVAYGGMTVDKRGNIYVIGGWSGEINVRVFSPRGKLLRKIGATPWGYGYGGAAIDSEENIYIANHPDHLIEVYDASGNRLNDITGGNLNRPHKLTLSPCGNLYVVEYERQNVKVFNSRDGTFLFSFPTLQDVWLRNLNFGPNGTLFVTADFA